MNRSTLLVLLCAISMIGGCAFSPAYVPNTQALEPGKLPAPDISLNIPQLRSCTDSPSNTIQLNSKQNG